MTGMDRTVLWGMFRLVMRGLLMLLGPLDARMFRELGKAYDDFCKSHGADDGTS